MGLSAIEATRSSLIGLLLRHPELAARLRVQSRHFVDSTERFAIEAIRALHDAGEAVDVVTVATWIETKYKRGRWAELSALLDAAGLSSAFDSYQDAVLADYARRQLSMGLADLAEEAKQGATVADLVASTTRLVREVQVNSVIEAPSLPSLLGSRIDEVEELWTAKEAGKEVLSGIPTGVEGLDAVLGGWPLGEVSVVAAPPGTGKTALNKATLLAATRVGVPSYFLNMEDPRAFLDRVVSELAGIPSQRIRRLDLTATEVKRLRLASQELQSREHFRVDHLTRSPWDAVCRARQVPGCKLVVVDYIQKFGYSEEEVSEAARQLERLAVEDGMAVVICSQLTIPKEQKADEWPDLQHLRWSKAIGEIARNVLFLKRKDNTMLINLAKCNNGETGIVKARWDGPHTRVW